jgi:rhodanese-related sulfurtransferase
MKQIRPAELAAWLSDDKRRKPILLDVRADWELKMCSLPGSLHIPMHLIPVRFGELKPKDEIVVICHHGRRSMQVAMFLQNQGFSALHNLTGGVEAWAGEVDPTMARY